MNPQSFVCMISCTNEVQNCRFAAAQNTVIVPEHPDDVLHHCSRELDARSGPSCVSTARGDPERSFQRPDERVLTIVPLTIAEEMLSKATASLTRHRRGIREADASVPRKMYARYVK